MTRERPKTDPQITRKKPPKTAKRTAKKSTRKCAKRTLEKTPRNRHNETKRQLRTRLKKRDDTIKIEKDAELVPKIMTEMAETDNNEC